MRARFLLSSFLAFLCLILYTTENLKAQEATEKSTQEVGEETSQKEIEKTVQETAVEEAPQKTFEFVEDRASVPILTPDLAGRQVRKLRLANKLEAYLISDPKARESAASMSVEVGAFLDPEGSNGMAHFLEHMLFLGTAKYPEESSYDQFMTSHGANRNAYTTNDHTNYTFSIPHEAFDEAIDRFSDFFKNPLFNPSGVDREMQAVDQEHAKNIELDSYRSFHVSKLMGNPEHPYSRFRTGNLETLSQISQESLIEFYREHYSANLMNLVIYSNRSLDELQEIVLEKFSPIENKDKEAFSTDQPMMAEAYSGHIAVIKPVKNIRTLTLFWEFPADFAKLTDHHPSDIVSYVLGHEGEESLLAQLKRENLAEGLQAGGFAEGKSHFVFHLKVDLTQQGVGKKEQVITRVFQAIARLQQSGISEALFKEAKQTALMRYQYQSRQSPYHMVQNHARGLTEEALETYPEWSEIPQKYDRGSIKKFLSLMSVDRCHFQLIAGPQLTDIRPDRVERWTGAEFSIYAINDRQLAEWRNALPHDNIKLPRPNPLLPESLALKHTLAPLDSVPVPTALVDDEWGKVYFAPDHYYGVPKVSWDFTIHTPAIDLRDPKSVILADLYVKSVEEALEAYGYYALMAGLQYAVEAKDSGIRVVISGYDNKARRLLNEVLKTLITVEPTPEQFAVYSASLSSDYENIERSGPLTLATESLRSILFERYLTSELKTKYVRLATREQLLSFRDQIFEKTYIEGMLFGNQNESEAREIWDDMKKAFDSSAYPKEEHKQRAVVSLPESHGPYYLEDQTLQQGTAVLLAIQGGVGNFKNRAIHDIFSTAMEEPFYSELRTKQQTGYIVFNYGNDLERQIYSFYGVQSNSHNARDLLARFELSIESFLQGLGRSSLDEARFDVIRKGWIARLKQNPKNIFDMEDLLSVLAFEYDGDFERIEKRLKSFEELTFEEFKEAVQQTHGKGNRQRIAVLISGEMPKETLNYSQVRNVSQIRKISSYVDKEETLSQSSRFSE